MSTRFTGTNGVTNQSDDAVEKTLGILSDVVNLALYAPPLETMTKVIQTKDASTLPIFISAIFLANGVIWIVFAIADDDMFVLIPNAISLVLCIVQVLLYMMYPPRSAKEPSVCVVGGEELRSPGAYEEVRGLQSSTGLEYAGLKDAAVV